MLNECNIHSSVTSNSWRMLSSNG